MEELSETFDEVELAITDLDIEPESALDDETIRIKTARDLLSHASETVEKMASDPKAFLRELRGAASGDVEVMSAEEIKAVVTKHHLFGSTVPLIIGLLGYVREKIFDCKDRSKEIKEIVRNVTNISKWVQMAEFGFEEGHAEIGKFLYGLLDDLYKVEGDVNPGPGTWLIVEIVTTFAKNNFERAFVIGETTERLASVRRSGVLQRNLMRTMSGTEIECFMCYAAILKDVLEDVFYNQNRPNGPRIGAAQKAELIRLLKDVNPNLSRELRYVFDECLSFLQSI